MPEENRILIVVPCFNEANRIPLDNFTSFLDEEPAFDFLFVNDGSADGTSTILSQACASFPGRFFFLELKENVGKAEAVRKGMLKGLQMGPYQFLGFLDADLATPLQELRYMLNYGEFKDGEKVFLFGSRIKILGSHISRNAMRHYFGRISATGASISLKLPVYDTQCGVKLFHQTIVAEIFRDAFTSRWLFDVEIFFRLKALLDESTFYKSVLEVPLRTWNEIPGTKILFSDILKVPLELYRINLRYRNQVRF